jgi:membrane associated rhomboid family serine protease
VSLRERVESVDVAVLLSIPVLLVPVQLLPESVRGALVMNYGSPSVLTMYTTHFVHAGWGHLAGNMLVYLVAVALVYALFLYADERRTFFVGFALILFVAPVPLSVMDLQIVGSQVGDLPSRGFSALASAFVGFLPVAVFVFLREEVSERIRVYESLGLFLVGLGVILVIYSGLTEPVTWVALVAGVLYYVQPVRKLEVEERRAFAEMDRWKFSVVAYAALFFVVSPFLLFPANPASGGQVTNVVTHFGGFAMGYAASIISTKAAKW